MCKSISIRECGLVPRRPRKFTTFCYLIFSVNWLLFDTDKICITEVVGIGLSPANNENNWLENLMGDSCKITYLGPGMEILGFQTGSTGSLHWSALFSWQLGRIFQRLSTEKSPSPSWVQQSAEVSFIILCALMQWLQVICLSISTSISSSRQLGKYYPIQRIFLKEREQCIENERILSFYRWSCRKSRSFLAHFQIPKRAIVQFISKLT